MATISISEVSEDNCDSFYVTVSAETTTTHHVTVDPAYTEKLTGGSTSAETLVEKSFEFLLARESNTSILSSFDLPLIAQYFPDYEEAIRGML
ncbi:MAG: hypothetical protein ACC661_06850 [Verrucomicrobiales bacterium]